MNLSSRLAVAILALSALLFLTPPTRSADEPKAGGKPSLKDALASLKTPPDWFATTNLTWDVKRPWKEGRIEIRRLLASHDESDVRQAVKLTALYAQKNDIGDGHELPMYLFMSGNYAWATIEYPKYLQKAPKGAAHAYRCYASCLAHFGEYQRALDVLNKAMEDLPAAQWRINGEAGIRDQMGDIYADMGDTDKAKQQYAEAMRLYPTSQQPYGRHLLPRKVALIQAKLDMLTMASLATAKLRDGTFNAKALGYADKKELGITLTIQSNRITDIKVDHEEKIDLGATKTIPQQIIAKQSLKVDVVTGATVTSQGLIDGVFKALKQAGLK